ncbi:hypothetical protein AZE42_07675 [Rhizopogon vesiculosus]|uniref:Protein kinase domain-containing protein n=1 Tax=Rhizopogon vesiculosus TaxID=180088 RepID=A0A1J8Q361_9AGAM|nr:hypothetical protein AZE42_07675 [Rhizopogon vesiculosus]
MGLGPELFWSMCNVYNLNVASDTPCEAAYACSLVETLNWRMLLAMTMTSQFLRKKKGCRTFESDYGVHLNLVRQCLSEEKSRPSIDKVIYLASVQHFAAVDLTNAVEQLNSDSLACGAFENVHRCRLQPINIDGGIRQAVLYDWFTSVSTCIEVAVKEIRPLNSTDMLKAINHENIVPLLGVADGFDSLLALVSPWLETGAPTGYLQREFEMLSYSRKFALLVDVAHGLQYLHLQDIIHGDLSGNNVLIDRNGKASLVDFGLSAIVPGRISQALLSTNPEALHRGCRPNTSYSTTKATRYQYSPRKTMRTLSEGSCYRFWRARSHIITLLDMRP